MSDQIHTYHNDSFNLDQAYNYTLLLQVEAASFSYAVVDKKQLLLLGTGHSLSELTDPQELLYVLTAPYKETIIGLPATGYTLVPTSIYAREHVADYARYLDVQHDEKVLSQSLDQQNFIIYKTGEKAVDAAQRFGLKNAVYANKGWIKAIAQTNPTAQTVYINTNGHKADFLYFSNGNIRFHNSFDYSTTDDLAYFAAFVAQELELTPGDITLVLSGIMPDDTQHRLSQFFKEFVFNGIEILDLPGEIPSHQIMTLAALSLCVSLVEA